MPTKLPFPASTTTGTVGAAIARGVAAVATLTGSLFGYGNPKTADKTAYVIFGGTAYSTAVMEGLLADGTTWQTAKGPDGLTDIALAVGTAARHVVVGLDYMGLRVVTTGGGPTSTLEAGIIV